jgi:imidazolonepropionase-like amidohydrolase
MKLDRLGTIAADKSADFIVRDVNPLDDVTNTPRIAGVYLCGERIDRAALSASWTTGESRR